MIDHVWLASRGGWCDQSGWPDGCVSRCHGLARHDHPWLLWNPSLIGVRGVIILISDVDLRPLAGGRLHYATLLVFDACIHFLLEYSFTSLLLCTPRANSLPHPKKHVSPLPQSHLAHIPLFYMLFFFNVLQCCPPSGWSCHHAFPRFSLFLECTHGETVFSLFSLNVRVSITPGTDSVSKGKKNVH